MSKAKPITETEFRRVLAVAGSSRYPERNRLCLLLSARAGMRVGEIRALDIEDVFDPVIGQIRDRIFLSAQRTKWNNPREVHLNRSVQRALSSYLPLRDPLVTPLIQTQSISRFRRTSLVSLYRRLYERAGIDTSSHAGRALFITSLADKGVSIRIIQKAVGHRSLQATNAYLDARPQEVSAAVGLLI